MQLKVFKAAWGNTEPLCRLFAKSAAAGYAGIECPPPSRDHEAEFRELLEQYQFEFIAQVATYSKDHYHEFAELSARAIEFKPIMIDCHSSVHGLRFEENVRFFEQALAIEKQAGIPFAHETHRGRAMFTPWTTAELLLAFPDLRINADFSHWCCTCESLLADQTEHLQLAISRAIHIHGRVGHREGPQVSDPAAPEYAEELRAHIGWWLDICRSRQAEGSDYMTFTPEFGPPGYMPTLPYTRQPIIDLWNVNEWIRDHFEQQYKQHIAGRGCRDG
jgi:sugar phosphate isomerase/epimerase